MELKELYCAIGLQEEVVRKLQPVSRKTDLGQIDSCLEQMLDMKTAAQSYRHLKVLFADDTDNLKMLYCQLECARRAFDRYREKHISEAVYIETMKCFTRFMNECRKKNGYMFFDRGWWTYRQVSMNLFRIGELEYQFEEYEGENVIGIHIPSDADLAKEAVDCSLKQADLFFQTYYGGYEYKRYICDSWLLSPALKPLLSEKSNILSFQSRFDIVREEKEDKEFIEWLFQSPIETDYKELPSKTDLQKKVRELLLHGGTVGAALGAADREKITV